MLSKPRSERLQRRFWRVAAAGACLLAAIGATWPLVTRLSTAVLLGTEHEATAPLFSIWTLWWTADRAAHGFAGYWNAPFFHPNPGVFTYSEPQPLTGLLVAPLWSLRAPPALIHNLALLALLTLNGLFAYRLARALVAPRLPALLGGLLAVTLPFVAKVSGVVNLTPLFGMFWTLDGLVRFGRDGSTRHAAWAAAGFLATYLTCQQYALMFAPFAMVAGVVAMARQQFRTRPTTRLALAGVTAAAGVLLVAWPALILRREIGFTRPAFVVQHLSARPVDFLTRPETAWMPVPPPRRGDTAGLFPGALLSGLAAAGMLVGVRDRRRRPWVLYLAGSGVAALLLAMGLNIELFGWRPFALLREVVPGLGELRTPFRFAGIAQLALPVLAAVGLESIQRRSVRRGAGLVLLLGLLAAAENLPVPAGSFRVPLSPRTSWSAWLAAQPEGTVIAHVPFPAGPHVSDYEIDAWRMFAQIEHRKPMLNGFSSFFPPGYTRLQIAMARQFPERRLLLVLGRDLGINMVVVDRSWLAAHGPQMQAQASLLQPVYTDSQVRIYRLRVPPGETPPARQSLSPRIDRRE